MTKSKPAKWQKVPPPPPPAETEESASEPPPPAPNPPASPWAKPKQEKPDKPVEKVE